MKNLYILIIILSISCKPKSEIVDNVSWVSADAKHLDLIDSVSVDLQPKDAMVSIKSIEINSAPLFSSANIDFSKFPNLEKIEIVNSMIDTLDLDKLNIDKSKIVELQLRNNKLRYIKGIGSCSNLQILDLSFNKLGQLPAGVEALTKLKRLNLIGTNIKSLPTNLLENSKVNVLLP